MTTVASHWRHGPCSVLSGQSGSSEALEIRRTLAALLLCGVGNETDFQSHKQTKILEGGTNSPQWLKSVRSSRVEERVRASRVKARRI
jgi:hypothetical protein